MLILQQLACSLLIKSVKNYLTNFVFNLGNYSTVNAELKMYTQQAWKFQSCLARYTVKMLRDKICMWTHSQGEKNYCLVRFLKLKKTTP